MLLHVIYLLLQKTATCTWFWSKCLLETPGNHNCWSVRQPITSTTPGATWAPGSHMGQHLQVFQTRGNPVEAVERCQCAHYMSDKPTLTVFQQCIATNVLDMTNPKSISANHKTLQPGVSVFYSTNMYTCQWKRNVHIMSTLRWPEKTAQRYRNVTPNRRALNQK